MKLGGNLFFYILFAFFLFAYLGLGIQKYNRFETGDDLALYSQALWRYSHFRIPFSSFKNSIILTDHFGPILFFLSPFYWVWPDPKSLIAAQQIIVVIGVIPVYLFSQKKLKNNFFSLVISCLYLYFIGIQSAVYADFHLATIFTTFFSFLLFFTETKKWRWFWLFIFICLLCKEDAPTYIFGLSIYLIIVKKEYKIGLYSAFISLFYFYLVNNLFIPLLSGQFLKIGNLGGKSSFFINLFFQSPADFIKNFFYPIVKVRNLFLILFSFGFLPPFSSLFWAIAPFNFLRFFSDPARYSLHFHYTAILAPILAFSFINILSKINFRSLKIFFILLAIAGNIYTNKPNLDPGFFTPPLARLFRKEFWVLPPRNQDYNKVISLIPKNSSISAQTAILPQLSHREKIYRFPHNYLISDYIILTPTEGPYPLENSEYDKLKEYLLKNENYQIIYQSYAAILFKKII